LTSTLMPVSTLISARQSVLTALLAQASPGLSGPGLLALSQGWARLTGGSLASNIPLSEAETEVAERVRRRLLETVMTVADGLGKFPTASVARAANETHAAELRDLAACLVLLQAPLLDGNASEDPERDEPATPGLR